MNVNAIKGIFTAIGSAVASLLGILYLPVILMVTCNLIDYATGIMAAKYRGKGISSKRGLQGIMKKIAMWLLVAVGAIIDQMLLYTAEALGMEWRMKFIIAAVVAVWIVCNEIISILENISDIGVKIPTFLIPLVKQIKKASESQIPVELEQDKKREKEEEDTV